MTSSAIFSTIISTILSSLVLVGCSLGHTHTVTTLDCTQDKICDTCGELIESAKAHTPLSPATCTEDSVCSVCSLTIEPAHGHKSHEKATCHKSEVCYICNTEINPRTEHNFVKSEDGKSASCTNCESIINYKNGHTAFIPETTNTGHYSNNLKAYYANAVLICGDYGLEYFGMNEKGNASYAEIINNFAAKYPNVNVTSLLVPKACAFVSPDGYAQREENQKNFINATYGMMSENIKKADAIGELSAHKGEYTYYRTDHHWTSLGAYYASRAFCEANGIKPHELYEYTTVTNTGYTGSLYGFSGGVASLRTNPDYTVARIPLNESEMTYKIGNTTYNGKVLNLNTNNYSSMFICGDQPYTRITTKTNVSGKKLIVFKESFGNAFVPYMVDYYDEIIVIDIRKETESIQSIISSLTKDNSVQLDALIINNVQGATSLQGYLKDKLMS